MNINFLRISGGDVKSNLINLKQLVFEVTDICNLYCKYCGYGEFYDGYDPRGKEALSIKKASNILNYLTGLWEDNIHSPICQPFTLGFYGGEPLIGINFIREVIHYTESLHITRKKLHYNMTTNGILLDKYMDYLVDKEFRLLISLDGNEKDHSYRVDHQGKNSHKKIMYNLRLLQRKYPDYFRRFVRFNTVLHDRNSVKSAYHYIWTQFGKKTKISSLNNSGIRKDKVQEFYEMFQNKDDSIEKTSNRKELETELFLEAPNISRLSSFLYRYSGNIFDSQRSLLYDKNKIETVPTGTCTPFSKKMFVSVNGKILPCERVNHEFAMGQVLEDEVKMDFEHIADMYNDYVFRFQKQCTSCACIRTCGQCVFQIDEIHGPNPRCHGYAGLKAFQNYVNENLDYLGKNPTLYKKIMHTVRIES
ncbi:MAG: radical SAM peptide maturase [Cytophagales bacterium]|nr:radical SAM peptide maturase [Cytophagales bacterium]